MTLGAQPDQRPRPTALFVLGFGRSGTSALARVLSLCGATLPAGLLGGTANNPSGCWEPRAALALNAAILHRAGSFGFDVTLRMQEDGALAAGERTAWVAKIAEFLGTLPAAPLVVIKEPQITVLSGMWFEAARLAGFDVAAAVAVRHPQPVIASSVQRARRQNYVQMSPELASAGWLKYTLLAERDTRGVPRVFVEYDNLMDDWRREVMRVATTLSVDLDARAPDLVEEFLAPELQHHRHDGPVPEPFGTDWMSTVYATVSAAARDEPWDAALLDRVYQAYRASERGFGAMFADLHRYRNLSRFIRPSMIRPVLELLAIAHRRKGPWA